MPALVNERKMWTASRVRKTTFGCLVDDAKVNNEPNEDMKFRLRRRTEKRNEKKKKLNKKKNNTENEAQHDSGVTMTTIQVGRRPF